MFVNSADNIAAPLPRALPNALMHGVLVPKYEHAVALRDQELVLHLAHVHVLRQRHLFNPNELSKLPLLYTQK